MATSNGQNGQRNALEGDYVPFRVDTSKPPVEEERIPLFYIDDTEYTGPRRVSAATALEALEVSATKGIAAAAFHVLIRSIGREAYDALVNCPQVTYEQAQALMTKLSDMYFAQSMEIAGK